LDEGEFEIISNATYARGIGETSNLLQKSR